MSSSPVRLLAIIAVALGAVALPMVPSGAAPVTISGAVFEDVDRDGVRDPKEGGWSDMGIQVFDAATGSFVAGAATGADGTYSIPGLAPGTYDVRVGEPWWRTVRDGWAPTTSDGVWPIRRAVTDADTTVDFGWRPITRSASLSSPVSTYVGPDGLRVESFTDAVDAVQIDATLRAGGLLGGETDATVVRFGYSDRSYCGTSVGGTAGSFAGFSATCYVSYNSWLDQHDAVLFHEYGHAWSLFHAYLIQQDDTLATYLEARGLAGDPRLETSHAWSPRELIAEDYRQLFGTSSAKAVPQENRDIPVAAEVPGLAEFLAETFTTAPAPGGTGDPAPAPDPDPTTNDEPPSATVVDPTDTSRISGTVDVAVSASDDLDAPNELDVDVWVADAWRPAVWDDARGRHVLELDTSRLPDGPHTIRARAEDRAGNVTESVTVTVTVDNPAPGPTVVAMETGSVPRKGGKWLLYAVVEVRREGLPAAGVEVVLGWSSTGRHADSGAMSCTTDAGGSCTASAEPRARTGEVEVGVVSPPSAMSAIVTAP